MLSALLVLAPLAASRCTDVIVRLARGTDGPLASLPPAGGSSALVHAALAAHAAASQADVQRLLDARGFAAAARSFWIDNTISVPAATPELIDELKSHPHVAAVEADATVHLPPVDGTAESADATAGVGPQGNIAELNTARLWDAGYRGQGVVVASIDSGVRWTHEALRSNYRGFAAGGA
eukprot:4067968-Prymnesium_polylepis.1